MYAGKLQRLYSGAVGLSDTLLLAASLSFNVRCCTVSLRRLTLPC